ncbi:MAG: TolC family outer membrane protein [Kiloniellales bacterium]
MSVRRQRSRCRKQKGRAVRSLAVALTAGCLAIASTPASAQTAQTLVEALALSYRTNPTLESARSQLRATNEAVPQALSNWRPTVTLSGSAGQRWQEVEPSADSSFDTQPRDVELSVNQPLYRGGRTVAQTNRAENEVLAERSRLTVIEQDVLFATATAFMDVWRDRSVLQLNINNEQVLARQLEASEDRFEVGEITRTDVAQSESRLAGATADRIQAEGNLTESAAIYEELVGELPGELRAPAPLEGLPSSLDDTVVQALERNPEVLQADFLERAADFQIRESIGDLLPEATLTGRLRYSEEQSSPDSEREEAEILAQLVVPIYQAGFVSSQVRQAKQLASQRLLEIDQARRNSQQQAVSAWEALTTARAQITSFQSQVEASSIALEGVRQENAVGTRTTLDVLDAEQELLDAQVSLVSAQRDEVVAGFQLLTAVGRMTAFELGLPVDIYDPVADYNEVRDTWFGLEAPGAVNRN